MPFERITVNPAQMNGVLCIRGVRIPVATVVGLVAKCWQTRRRGSNVTVTRIDVSLPALTPVVSRTCLSNRSRTASQRAERAPRSRSNTSPPAWHRTQRYPPHHLCVSSDRPVCRSAEPGRQLRVFSAGPGATCLCWLERILCTS